MADYGKLAADLQGAVKQLGDQRAVVQKIVDQGGTQGQTDAAVGAIVNLVAAVKASLANAPLTDEERKRKMAALQSQIDLLKIIDANDPDFQKRVDSEREIARLTAQLGVYQSQAALQFADLLDDDGNV